MLTFLSCIKTVAFFNAGNCAEWLRFTRISLGGALFYSSPIGMQTQVLSIDYYERAASFRSYRPLGYSKNSRWHSG
jgi:hypothetical protein